MKRNIFLLIVLLLFAISTAQAGLLTKSVVGGGVLFVAAGGLKGMVAKHCHNPDGSFKEGCYDPNLPRDAQAGATAFGQGAGADDADSLFTLKSRDAKILRKNLNADRNLIGLPPDPEDCEAHHIVPVEDGRNGIKQFTDAARKTLYRCIDINSSENGIFLPNKEGGQGCEGTHNHRTIHNGRYYQPIMERLVAAEERGGCESVKNELKIIKNLLKSGEMP